MENTSVKKVDCHHSRSVYIVAYMGRITQVICEKRKGKTCEAHDTGKTGFCWLEEMRIPPQLIGT